MIIGKKTTIPGSNYSDIRINDVAMTLTSIAITTPPTKTTYYITDDFEPAGMQVTATYTAEGSGTFTRVVTDYDYSPRSFDTAGTVDVVISYTYKGVTKTATQQVTVAQAVSYQITDNMENGALSGDNIIVEGHTANVTILPLEDAILPQTKEVISVTGATFDSYDATTGAMVISNPTTGVVISGRCPDEDTWMDTVVLGGKTYREIFANQTEGSTGPKIMMYDGMTYFGEDKMCVYSDSGSTGFNVGLENADTLGRSLIVDNGPSGSRAAWLINKPTSSGTAIWTTGKWAVGDSIFLAAKLKGGLVSGERPEPGQYTKLGINQGSSGQPAGVIYIADIGDANESEFANWTTRTCLAQATVASGSGNAYFGFASLAAATVRARYYVDDVFIINVTKLFGAGNEPSQADLTALYEDFVYQWKYHNEADAPTPPTPPTPTGYTITSNLTNGSLTGDTEVSAGGSANVTIVPTSTYSLPLTKEMVSVTGATFDSYDATTGAIAISNATGNVTVTARCPDPDTWMDEVVLGGKTYREIFANQTEDSTGPKLMMYDGMTCIRQDKSFVYDSSGQTAFYTGTANADTVGRSLYFDNTGGTRACFCINAPDKNSKIWTTGKFALGDLLFAAAYVKGGLVSGERPAEATNYTKMGVNQGSSGMAFGTCALVEVSDPNESEFADWTVRTKLQAADKASNSGYAYFGFPSVSSWNGATFAYYVDNVFVINVTKLFGAGNEPTEADLTTCYQSFVTAWKSHNE